jgi:hypothetical protein
VVVPAPDLVVRGVSPARGRSNRVDSQGDGVLATKMSARDISVIASSAVRRLISPAERCDLVRRAHRCARVHDSSRHRRDILVHMQPWHGTCTTRDGAASTSFDTAARGAIFAARGPTLSEGRAHVEVDHLLSIRQA